MPLGAPVPRERLHRREIAIEGFARDDGNIDVEAHLTDVKAYDFARDDGSIRHAGEPLHDMWMRLTVSPSREILACEAAMEATPYALCPGVAPNFARLAGLKIESGFVRQALARVGGTEGCTHLRELLQQMGTVAFATLYSLRRRQQGGSPAAPERGRRPALLDSCYAYDSRGPVVAQQFPDWFTG